MTVIWVVALRCVAEVHPRFGGVCCLNHRGPDNGESKHQTVDFAIKRRRLVSYLQLYLLGKKQR
jgi:hypothetical protein